VRWCATLPPLALYKIERATPYLPHSGAGATVRQNQNMKENILTQQPRQESGGITDIFQFEVVRKHSIWVFDDAAKGVQNEPFVCGMNEIIDAICQRFNIPPVDGQRIRATFCDERAVDHRVVSELAREGKIARLVFDQPRMYDCPSGYTPYEDQISGLHGAFCPVFKAYFPEGNSTTPKVLLLLPEKA